MDKQGEKAITNGGIGGDSSVYTRVSQPPFLQFFYAKQQQKHDHFRLETLECIVLTCVLTIKTANANK